MTGWLQECPHCHDLAPHPALTCPGCGYWPLREPTAGERLDHQLEGRRVRVQAHQRIKEKQ